MALGDVAGLLNPMIEAAAGMADAFVPIGRILLVVAFSLATLNAVYSWWMGEVSGALARAVRSAFVLAVPLFLLWGNNWITHMHTFTNFFAVELAAPVLEKSGTSGGNASAPELVKSVVERVANGVWPAEQAASGEGALAKAWSFITNPDASIGRAIYSAWTEFFYKLLLTIVGAVLIISILFALFGPILLMQVGVIFGPVLIVWLAYEPLADLAKTWFRFMLSAGFSLLVGLVLALIAVGAVEGFVQQMQAMGSDPELPWFLEIGAKIGGFLASSATMLFLSFMLFRADDIASAMVGGSAGGGSAVGAAMLNKLMPRGVVPKSAAPVSKTGGGTPPPPPPPSGGAGGTSIAGAGK